jgi:hypothetical protein
MDHIDFILWATFTKFLISVAEIFNVEIIKINNPTILKKYIFLKKMCINSKFKITKNEITTFSSESC